MTPGESESISTRSGQHKREKAKDPTRELEAEAVAFVIGHALGLDVTDAARDYIHLYRGDADALAESLGRIQRTAAGILTAIGIPGDVSDREESRSAA